MKKQKEATIVGFVFLLMIVLYMAFSFTYSFLYYRGVIIPPIVATLIGELVYLLPAAVYLFARKVPLKYAIGLRMPKVWTLFLSVIVGFLSIPIASFLNLVSQLFVSNTMLQSSGLFLNSGMLLTLLISSVLAPVIEEIICRGVLLHSITRLSTPMKGILISSFCFGLMHLNFNQFLYAFGLGVIFALTIRATGSIFSSVIVHITINGTNVLLLIVSSKAYELMGEDFVKSAEETRSNMYIMLSSIVIYAVISIVCTILLVLLLRYMARIEGRSEVLKNVFLKRTDLASPRVFLNVPMILGIVICIAIMILSELKVI